MFVICLRCGRCGGADPQPEQATNKELLQKIAALEYKLDILSKFHNLAVNERNYERSINELLEKKLRGKI